MAGKSFEENLKRLEEIVSRLEDGDTTLEESMRLFEEGMKLARKCSEELDKAERKVEILIGDGKGGIKTEPFPAEE